MNTYEQHTYTDIRLPFIFNKKSLSSSNRANIFPTLSNWHENIEIVFVTDGEGVIYSNDMSISVEAGDIVIISPNSLHSFTTSKALEYYYLIVDRSFCLGNHFDTNALHFEAHFRDAKLFELLTCLITEYAKLHKESFAPQQIRATVLHIMALICQNHSSKNEGTPSDTSLMSCIKQAIGYIHSEYRRDISLDEISHFVGLSSYYFAREFKRITGYTFVSYLNLVRCENAKLLLSKKQASVSKICRECGFSNQSYFTRIFKRYTGTLPTEYQKKNKS